MSKKVRCPHCKAIIEIDKSQKLLHCDGCGKNYKNPYYEEIEVVENDGEEQNTTVLPTSADADKKQNDSTNAGAVQSEPIVPSVPAEETTDDIDEEKLAKVKKKLVKSAVAMLVLSSVLLIIELAILCYLVIVFKPIRLLEYSSIFSFIIGIVCFIASLVVFFNRKNVCDADKTSLIILIIALCVRIVACILPEGMFAGMNIGLISFIIRYSIIIALLVLSAVNLKNIKPFIPKYVVPAHFDGHSEFNVGLLSLIWLNFVNNLIIGFTLGLCTPWAVRREYTWLYEHQVIDDKKLVFDGNAASLFGQWVKWTLLSFVTFGIYALFVPIKKMQWITKHTHIKDVAIDKEENKSEFDGKFWSYWGMRLVNGLIIVFSLGICAPWAIVREQRWLAEHQIFDGQRLVFDGSAMGLFGQWIKWMLLSIITLGIYAWWIPIKKQKWITEHTHFSICAEC